MKKRSIIIVVLLLIIIILVDKMLYLNKITSEKIKNFKELMQDYLITDLKVINKEKIEESITFQNISFENNSSFNCNEDTTKLTCTYNDSTLKVEKSDSYKKTFETYDKNKVIKNINSDIELFGLLKEYSTKKINILTRRKSLEEYKLLEEFANKYIKKILSIDLVEGDYSGYILHTSSNERELYITNNNTNYKFTFTNTKYFTDDYIEKFINKIEIKENKDGD